MAILAEELSCLTLSYRADAALIPGPVQVEVRMVRRVKPSAAPESRWSG
jgi:hypothetical protein